MSRTARSGLLSAFVATLFVAMGMECPGTTDTIIPIPGTGTVTLQIRNESGFRVKVESEFVLEDFQVRETLRVLDPTGLDAEASLLPTRTHFLSVVAVIADDSHIPPSALVKPGDVLAEAAFEWNVNFKDGDVILFVIPAPDTGGGDTIDCNSNGISDLLDLQSESSADCNSNGIPDECDISEDPSLDCNANGTMDECEESGETTEDCNHNGVFDKCDISSGNSPDCNENGIPDECDISGESSYDCNENGKPDECDIVDGHSEDCQSNGIPDECDIADGESDDCNSNGVPDECDLEHGAIAIPRQILPQTEGSLLFPVDETHTLAMAPNDDGSSAQINLGFGFELYGSTYHAVFINNNGNISFGAAYPQFTSTGFPVLNFPMIAPFWADVDTRSNLGRVVYKLTDHMLIATWENVGYFNQKGDKRNTFQVAISDGTDTTIGIGQNVAFSYGNMQWTTGDASNGSEGFGGVPATAGANAGDNENFFQIGRFSLPGNAYDGPHEAADGIDFLDYQTIRFSTSDSIANVAPIATGLPSGGVLRVNPRNGESVDLLVQYLSPEAPQTTSVVVQDVSGAAAQGLTIENTPGNTADLHFVWTPDCNDEGLYEFVLTAQDNFVPPGISTSTFHIHVICRSEDCNENQTPDECESDCNSNGRPDDCDLAQCEGQPGCSDCNENGTLDGCEIASGDCLDENHNLIPDECDEEQALPRIGDHGSVKFMPPIGQVTIANPIPLDDHPTGITLAPGISAHAGSANPPSGDPSDPPASGGLSPDQPVAVETHSVTGGISVLFSSTPSGSLPVWTTVSAIEATGSVVVDVFGATGECIGSCSSSVLTNPIEGEASTFAVTIQVNEGISRIHIHGSNPGGLVMTAPEVASH